MMGESDVAAAAMIASGRDLAAAMAVDKSNSTSKHRGAVASLLSKAERATELAAEDS